MFHYKDCDLIYILREMFIRVFEIPDVEDYLIEGNIFTLDEFNDIIPNPEECILSENAEQIIDKVFFYLVYKQKNIPRFFEIIGETGYAFVTKEWNETVNQYKQSPNTRIDEFYEFLRYSEIPKNRDTLVHRLDYLWDVQQHLQRLLPGDYLILTGKPNHGKKWIACDAVTNLHIATLMNFKIFWLNMHNCDTLELILEKLMKLKIIIGGQHNKNLGCNYSPDSSIKNKIYCLKKELQKTFQQEKFRTSLLVLTGVQNQKVLESFEFYCKTLITTRFPGIYQFISEQRRHVIPINKGFTNLEAEQYFLKFFKKNRLTDIEIKYVHKINNLCRGIPLILNIIARRLTQFHFNISIQEEIWEDWIRVLRSNEYAFNEVADIERTFQKISKSDIKHFEQLVVFRYNINVPISVLTKYWITGSDMKTQEILVTLKNSALVEIELIDNKIFCHINYVMYNFLINKFRNSDRLINMHKKIVNVYSVPEVLENRKKYYLPGFVDDKYFYEHIGYHLIECQMRDLLVKLYKDFRFIERKIRSTSLLNTINDLKSLHRLLVEWDSSKHFFDELICNFLPSVEEQILISSETCLLQLALSWHRGLVKNEALRQAELLENHLWFEDIHKSKFHEIVPLPHNVTVAHFYKQDTALFAMSDNTIILKNFNLSQITIFKGHRSKIIQILTLDYDYFLSLGADGIVKLWCLKHSQVLNHDQKLEFDELDKNKNDFLRFYNKEEVKFSVQDIKLNDNKKIISMKPKPKKYVEFLTEVRDHKCYLYNYKYDVEAVNYSKILKHYDTYTLNNLSIDVKYNVAIDYLYFFISGCGDIICENAKDKTNVEIIKEDEIDNGLLINIHQSLDSFNLIFVYESSIKSYKLQIINDRMHLRVSKLFVLADNFNKINFSLMTKDKKCLILATNRGCYMYNFYQQRIIETNIKESVLTLDAATISCTEDEYLVIFSTKKFQNIVYKWYVEQDKTIYRYNPNLMAIDLPLIKYGKDVLYDVNYDGTLDGFTVYSVIGEIKVQKTTCASGASIEKIYEPPEMTSKITKISTSNTCTVLACEDNSLYLIDVENKESLLLKQIPFPIAFVKCFDRNTILISVHEKSDRNYLVVNGYEWLHLDDIRYGTIQEAHRLYDNYILLIVNNMEFCVLELNTTQIISSVIFDCPMHITNFVANSMFIYKGGTYFYECDLTKQKVIKEEITPRTLYSDFVTPSNVKCFDVTENKTKLAIGYENGTINVFRIPPAKSVLQLMLNVGFNAAINDLRFSPFAKPLLLIVLGDRIYFYNLDAAIKQIKLEEIQRRNTKPIGIDPERHICVTLGPTQSNNKNKRDLCLWHNKIGHHDLNNCENFILSCYKLVGNSPNKFFCNKTFTNFLAIDNEENIHYLRLLDFKKDKSNHLVKFMRLCYIFSTIIFKIKRYFCSS